MGRLRKSLLFRAKSHTKPISSPIMGFVGVNGPRIKVLSPIQAHNCTKVRWYPIKPLDDCDLELPTPQK